MALKSAPVGDGRPLRDRMGLPEVPAPRGTRSSGPGWADADRAGAFHGPAVGGNPG